MRELDAELRMDRLAAAGLDERALAPLLAMQFAAWRRDRAVRHPHAVERIVLLHGRPSGLLSTERVGAALVIVDLLLAARARGRGVGSAVLHALLAEADEPGLIVSGHIEAANERALSFYTRAGFDVIARDPLGFTIEHRPNAR